MSTSVTFKCPGCGAYLEFDPKGGQFACPYCGAQLDEAELRRQSAAKEQDAPAGRAAAMRGYHCQNCGAEIVTTDTTAATRCYYCHSPVVLTDRLSEDFRPDGVLPFAIDEKQAREKFDQFIAKKRFVDRRFFSKDQLTCFSGVYYPYWYGEVEGDAAFTGSGTRTDVTHTPRETITITKHFRVTRRGKLHYEGMVRKALRANDRKLSDGIFPYDEGRMKPFATGYLSGFLAEKRDVPEAEAAADMVREAQDATESVLRQDAAYDTLTGQATFVKTGAKLRYVLLPTWVLTYKGDRPGATYFYMMNGQKGTVCGKLPINKVKLALWSAGCGLAVFALMCLGGALLW